jgi:WD40 repeat protein
VNALRFTPDGRLLTSGSGGVRLWDLETGESEWLLTSDRWLEMSADGDGRFLLTAEPDSSSNSLVANLTLFDRTTGASRPITSHGEPVGPYALDPTGTIIVTGVQGESLLQVGSVDDSEPHLLYGHEHDVCEIAISPDSCWIAAGDEGGTIRLWPMPDVSKPALHTLPHDELIARLKTFTNLRVVRDEASPDEWKVEPAPFPGWEEVSTWW